MDLRKCNLIVHTDRPTRGTGFTNKKWMLRFQFFFIIPVNKSKNVQKYQLSCEKISILYQRVHLLWYMIKLLMVIRYGIHKLKVNVEFLVFFHFLLIEVQVCENASFHVKGIFSHRRAHFLWHVMKLLLVIHYWVRKLQVKVQVISFFGSCY